MKPQAQVPHELININNTEEPESIFPVASRREESRTQGRFGHLGHTEEPEEHMQVKA